MVSAVTDNRAGDGAAPGPIIGALQKSKSLHGEGGKAAPTCAGGAHGWRPDFGAARSVGYRLPAPTRLSGSDRPSGKEGWSEETA